jgi:hypothetical protein
MNTSTQQRLQPGMTVRTAEGEKLGKVVALGETQFQLESGVLVRREFLVNYEDVRAVEGDQVILHTTEGGWPEEPRQVKREPYESGERLHEPGGDQPMP